MQLFFPIHLDNHSASGSNPGDKGQSAKNIAQSRVLKNENKKLGSR